MSYNRTHVWEGLTPLQRCSQRILQPKSTGPQDTRLGWSYPPAEMQSAYSAAQIDWATGHSLGRVLPLCRDAVGVFYSPNRLGHRTLVWEGLTPLQRCSRRILQPKSTGPQDTCLGGSYPPAEMQSAYSTAQIDWATGHSFRRVLPLCRDAVGVFYSANRLGHRTLVREGLTPLQRCSRRILHPNSTGPQDTRLGGSYPSAEMQSAYSTAQIDWATGHSFGRVLPLCRDAVGVFYSPNRLGHRILVWEGLTPLQRCSRRILQPKSTGPQDTR